MKILLQKTNRMLQMQILFVVLAFITMVLVSYAFMSNIVRERIISNAEGVLDAAEIRVSADLREYTAILDSFSEMVRGMILQGDTPDMLKEYINNMSKFSLLKNSKLSEQIQGFYGYFETLPGGSEFIYDGIRPLPEDFDPVESEWYQLAVSSGNNIVCTTPYVSDTNDTSCIYAKCISDDKGRRLGVVCMDVILDSIGEEVISTALNSGGYGMLINQSFLMMAHPNADYIGMHLDNPVIPVSIYADDLRGGNKVFESPLTSYQGEKAVAFFREMHNGWFLGLVTPKDQFYKGITNMAIILCLLGGTLAFILIVILIRIDMARTKSDDENKRKRMFLANMSHEIRTPINAIVGMTSIGRAAGTAERKDYCFSKIDNASKHLLGVVNDILDMSKIEANKIELSPSDFNFEKMLQQAVNVINFRADEKRHKLTVHIDKAIPKFLFADDQRFAQVITNILSNAVKFTPVEGAISLKTNLLSSKNGIYTIKVEVTDTGIGISPEQQAKLFRPFQQAESFTTRKYGGTGLGLVISKTIVEMMGGKIWIESAPEKGATFAFTVKVKRAESSPSFELGRQGVNWKNIRILTIDDDPDILLYFQEIVAGLGAKCEVAPGAEEALRLIKQNGAYNIYFIDLKMPKVDGISLTKEIRAMEGNSANSVVIMISSADLNAVENDAKKAGVNKFLLKPIFPSSIADMISECIGIVNDNADKTPPDINGIFAGRRILLAEDVDINREIMLALLKPTLAEIDCAENGFEAVKMFKETPDKYDLIFMDIQMPEIDGYGATRKIRELNFPSAKTVPIIAMTANVFKEDIENCLAAGMNGHLGKPIDINALLKTAFKYLKTNR